MSNRPDLSLQRVAAATLTVLLAVAGCESAPTRFYTLEAGATADAPAASTRSLTIGLGPVSLAKYLDREGVVKRESRYEVSVSELDQWAEPLDSLVPRVLAESLSRHLGTSEVYVIPRRRPPAVDYQIEAEIPRFDADASGTVELTALWEVYSPGRDDPLLIRRSNLQEEVAGPGYAEVAAAMSRALEGLSAEMAQGLRTVATVRPPARRPAS
jgi:hypothetical protein